MTQNAHCGGKIRIHIVSDKLNFELVDIVKESGYALLKKNETHKMIGVSIEKEPFNSLKFRVIIDSLIY